MPVPTRLRRVAVTIIVAVSVILGVNALAVERGPGVASALPPALEKSLSSGEASRSFDIKSATVESHQTDDGTTVFVATDKSGGTCIGLSDGGAACGSEEAAAAGNVHLTVIDVSGRHVDDVPLGKQQGEQGQPATAHLFGLQPNPTAASATALDTHGRAIDKSPVRDGVYEIHFTVGARSARLAEVRFTTGDRNANDVPAVRLAD